MIDDLQSFNQCTQPLGPLRQPVFSCLTCNPPTGASDHPYVSAGICYSCSIACHGEHELVELFNHRDFVCDCGTSRLPPSAPCTLRINPETGMKGPVHSQKPRDGNTYNQNFRNHFCGCGELYDAHTEKGTMFQCLGLATEADGGCGEDWWHPECVMALPRKAKARSVLDEKAEPSAERSDGSPEDEDDPLPLGFPSEDDFETFICYKCVNALPWIRRYAETPGFLPPVTYAIKPPAMSPIRGREEVNIANGEHCQDEGKAQSEISVLPLTAVDGTSRKRKSPDSEQEASEGLTDQAKRPKLDSDTNCYTDTLPEPLDVPFSLFLAEDFRDHLCRCSKCYPNLKAHPQLLEEEDSYEPPLSESGNEGNGSVGTGSLLERGEAALNNMDRVKAIGKPEIWRSSVAPTTTG